MRVIWICNTMLPLIAKHLNREQSVKEGWISGLASQVLCGKNSESTELAVCFPMEFENGDYHEKLTETENGQEKTIWAYGFYEDLKNPEKYNTCLEERFSKIFKEFQPDVIHCFGTEYGHTLAALRAAGKKQRVLIGIQGICDELARVYETGIPERICRRFTLRDFLRQDSIHLQKKKFAMRGRIEKEVLREAFCVTGRTDFDYKWAKRVNPKVRYYQMNETLRPEFYKGRWNPEGCTPHSIFLSQGDYPIKGLHYMIQALPEILKEYPDTRVFVAGQSIVRNSTVKEKLKISSYGKYLLTLMKENKVEDRVVFLGKLDAGKMKERYLLSQLFVCPSILENSPNSLGEAMLLGVPCIAAETGGIPSMFSEKEGILFKAGDVKALADAVKKMWKNDELQQRFSENARKRALCNHDAEINYNTLLGIYRELRSF